MGRHRACLAPRRQALHRHFLPRPTLCLSLCVAAVRGTLFPNGTCVVGSDGSRLCGSRRDVSGTERALQQQPAPSGSPSSKKERPQFGGPTDVFPMFTRIEWLIFSGVSDAKATIEGVVQLESLWPKKADAYLNNAHDVISIDNFASGSSGIITQPKLDVEIEGASWNEVSQKYVGVFKQSFDPICYPFDSVTTHFDFNIHPPGSFVFEIIPLCFGDGHTAYDADGNVVEVTENNLGEEVVKCVSTKTEGSIANGFLWTAWVCTRQGTTGIRCEMSGTREYTKLMETWILPSTCVTLMSFLSFKINVKSAMPRIATTMIAMLTLINLKMSVANRMPVTGNTSWLEFLLGTGTVFMLMNLCGHVIAFWLNEKKQDLAVAIVNDLFFEVTACVAVIIPLARIFSAGCGDHVNIPLIACLLFLAVAMLVYQIVTDFPKWLATPIILKELWASQRKEGGARTECKAILSERKNSGKELLNGSPEPSPTSSQLAEPNLMVVAPAAGKDKE
eukprot:TRINITY_DN4376_c0_g1_i2.p1 TRINITY_DN4376_c0_g1~~TRINITY_DN4376_c0_g1_i2.p1  ORF type:complete len:505 (-),score=107.14 TRINITY_DN4376_c0_g1_i2:132-1646(-)